VVQARRKKPAKSARKTTKRSGGFGIASQCLSFLFAGILIGVLSTLFWQGYRTSHQGDIGSGLKDLVDKSRLNAEKQQAVRVPTEPIVVDAPRKQANYDFYTVLPAIEEVLPKDSEPTPKVVVTDVSPSTEPETANTAQLPAGTAYYLQVASYQNPKEADRLKAELALSGLRPVIQNVSIDNKQYYRVRIGPYSDYGSMTADDYQLSQMGFKALRLRVSGG
jgi:cell division protein FtsN